MAKIVTINLLDIENIEISSQNIKKRAGQTVQFRKKMFSSITLAGQDSVVDSVSRLAFGGLQVRFSCPAPFSSCQLPMKG